MWFVKDPNWSWQVTNTNNYVVATAENILLFSSHWVCQLPFMQKQLIASLGECHKIGLQGTIQILNYNFTSEQFDTWMILCTSLSSKKQEWKSSMHPVRQDQWYGKMNSSLHKSLFLNQFQSLSLSISLHPNQKKVIALLLRVSLKLWTMLIFLINFSLSFYEDGSISS